MYKLRKSFSFHVIRLLSLPGASSAYLGGKRGQEATLANKLAEIPNGEDICFATVRVCGIFYVSL